MKRREQGTGKREEGTGKKEQEDGIRDKEPQASACAIDRLNLLHDECGQQIFEVAVQRNGADSRESSRCINTQFFPEYEFRNNAGSVIPRLLCLY